MEPNQAMIDSVLFPASVDFTDQDLARSSAKDIEWDKSILNPKNRANKFATLSEPVWRIDGADVIGSRFYAVPSFALNKPPLRIDLFLPSGEHFLAPPFSTQPALITKDHNIKHLDVCKHLVCGLEEWSVRTPSLEQEYFSLPFGSRVVLEAMSPEINRLNFHLVPNNGVEQQWLSIPKLQSMWNLPFDKWPESIALDRLGLIRQIHEAICLVKVNSPPGTTSTGAPLTETERVYAFKAVSRDVPSSYHELKVLLTLDSHPNILPRPKYIVTKKAAFGGKRGICGFLMDYHHHGNMQTTICDSLRTSIPIQEKIRWAKNLVSALIQISNSSIGFYSNLKLLNIVMEQDAVDPSILHPVLIDFEQRSGGFCWSAPEVHYMDYLENRANYGPNEQTRSHFSELLRTYDPDWQPYSKAKRYTNPEHGFSLAWKLLSRSERESAQVYMVGKLLWCIFENMPSPGSWPTYETFREKECEIVFPQFKYTPECLKECIKNCTKGAPEWDGKWPGVRRRGGLLYPFDMTVENDRPLGTAEATRLAAKAWWEDQIIQAEKFFLIRRAQKEGVMLSSSDKDFITFMTGRLSLKEVFCILEEFETA
ncbi:hypothetical protein ABW20_dc0104240 [Dactylellina cionopaga]|nr:hypothetical protein ABW20_dc0104240 [Dactylellina cionopaga]